MDHIFILIRVVAYTVGLVNLVAMTTIFLLFRYRAVLLSVVLMIPFTIVLVGETWMTYLRVNMISDSSGVLPAVVTHFGVGLMIVVLPLFSHRVSDKVYGPLRGWLFGVAGVASFVIAVGAEFGFVPPVLRPASLVLLGGAIAYSAGFGIVASRRERRRRYNDIVRIATLVARSMVVFLPLLIVFDFFHAAIPWMRDHVPETVTVLPFFYVFWNSLLLANAVRSLRRLTDGSVVRPENAARQFGLTDRESEVLAELMRGSSYAEIGAKLFISLATVKTHVNRIYRKTDTRSRPELMNRLRPVYGDGAESQPSC